MKGQMKVIGFEEHYGLPFIHDAALKANDPYAEVLEAMRKSGQFPEDPKTGTPAGIYDLAEGRIAAMDDAGIDVQILSYATPSAERLEPSVSRGLIRGLEDPFEDLSIFVPDRGSGTSAVTSENEARRGFISNSRASIFQWRAACR